MAQTNGSNHAARVAAIATELAGVMRLSEQERRDLREAALCHDSPFLLMPAFLDRLALDLGIPLPAPTGAEEDARARVQGIVSAFENRRPREPELEPLALILEAAHSLDEELERRGYDEEALGPDSLEYGPVERALGALRASSRDELRAAALKLPIFPKVLQEAIRMLTAEATGPPEIEKLVARDPVLAGSLLQAANSALYHRRMEARSIVDAVNYLGLDLSRQVLLAAVMRGVFGTPSLRPHWSHAIEAADAAMELAAASGLVSAAEAGLAGLVHDVGLLAIAYLNPTAAVRRQRLIASGVPPAGAEWIVLGFSHAEASAVVLEVWRFPSALIDAVRLHHSPSQTEDPMASLLYLVEFLTCTEEDYPSTVLLTTACRRLGFDVDEVVQRRIESKLGLTLSYS